jgi:hypothetical protein
MKATPSLPASSRMQMPSSSASLPISVSRNGKATANIKSGGTAKLVTVSKSGGGLKKSNPYC